MRNKLDSYFLSQIDTIQSFPQNLVIKLITVRLTVVTVNALNFAKHCLISQKFCRMRRGEEKLSTTGI